jgi:hypothetical protein
MAFPVNRGTQPHTEAVIRQRTCFAEKATISTDQVNMLCAACQRIFDDSPKIASRANGLNHPRLWMHHPYPYLLESSAQNGCQVCRLLWEKFSPAEKHELRRTVPTQTVNLSCPFPLVAALLGLTPCRWVLLPVFAATQAFDILIRPLSWFLQSVNKVPTPFRRPFEFFAYLLRSAQLVFNGNDYQYYGWQVELATAEYQPLSIDFRFAGLNWDGISVTMLPARGLSVSASARCLHILMNAQTLGSRTAFNYLMARRSESFSKIL